MLPKFHQLDWLKSRTFWQVAFALITITLLQAFTKGIPAANNSFTNYSIDSEPTLGPIQKD